MVLGHRGRGSARVHALGDRRLDEIQHDGPAELLLGCLVEPTPVRCHGLAQLLGRPCSKCCDERPVDGGIRGMARVLQSRDLWSRASVATVLAILAWERLCEERQRRDAVAGHDRAPSSSSARRREIAEWMAATVADRLRINGPMSNRFGGVAPRWRTAADSGSSATVATTGRFRTLVTSRDLYGWPSPIRSTAVC